ncbi:protein of unknown function DUF502 [Candidatus Amoebophilus asiaticus 5a2]|uniref:DUF502 domain-containing protein n=1 Tax=Amoebophilus asiaticus (strain 5a2) TaxID=452471 RepID=B3EUJ0_AMOA5|nr:DUF502 domain-containing protein [Candidatus Amoebophilus asiaticus]ACE05609.1 protein of unknown function DUF502 [Candidatus Amoebophilus asiaticus 5a2]
MKIKGVKKTNKQLFNTLLGYFLRGLLLIVPFVLTGYIISMALNWMDGIIKIKIPGLGITIVLVAITLFGYLGSTLLVRSLFDTIEKLVTKVPLISTIYTSLKDLIAAFVGNKKKFDKPVLVTIDIDRRIQKIGFITQQELEILHLPASVAVYIPDSYSFSGGLCIVPKELITPLPDISGTEVMKFVISGGVTAIQNVNEEEQIVNFPAKESI